MPTKTKIPLLPVATSINLDDIYILQQNGVTKQVSQKTVSENIEDADLSPISGTYDEVDALIKKVGRQYIITDATQANISLILTAVSNDKFHTDAKSPDFPQDVIEYDFENDVITWRWDTINDISTAQDLRNLQGLTIGTGCARVHTGIGVTGTIGNNNTDLDIGDNSSITTADGVNTISCGANCVLDLKTSSNASTFGFGCEATARFTACSTGDGCVVMPSQGYATINVISCSFQPGCTVRLPNVVNCYFGPGVAIDDFVWESGQTLEGLNFSFNSELTGTSGPSSPIYSTSQADVRVDSGEGIHVVVRINSGVIEVLPV